MQETFCVAQCVSSAISLTQPVVALESSVFAQGLPKEVAFDTALALEEVIREAGATPATIGVIQGKVKVGLTREEIEKLSAGNAAKLATRDLAYAMLKGIDGGTTVSSTARIASAVGINVVATGGIGGVHHGFDESHDVSADLWELVRTPVIVVCSGPKAVVDVRATEEWLETHGIPVVGIETDELPCFYSRRSGIKIPRIESALEFAQWIKLVRGKMGLSGAVIAAVPISESDELNITEAISRALAEASAAGVSGKELTPYLLARVAEITEGRSVTANIALLKNNARKAADIASAMSDDTSRRMGFLA